MGKRDEDFWTAWQNKRRKELQALGFSRQDAKLSAKFERRQREIASRLVGNEAARDQTLMIDFSPCGRYRTTLSIPESAVPPQYRARAAAWAAEHQSTRH